MTHLLQQDHRLVVLLRMSVFSFRLLQEYTVYYTGNVFIEVVKFFQKSFLFIDLCCQNNLSWLRESKRFSQNDATVGFRAKPSFCSILIPGQCWLSDVSPYFVCRASFSLSLFILNCFSLPWNCDFCLSPVSLLERMTTYLSFLAIVHSCSLASVNTALQEVSKNLNHHIQWYPRYLRLIQQLGCQLQISLQTFLFIVPGSVSSLIFFYFPFLFSFHLFFIYCVNACTHIPWYNKISEESFLSPDHVCDFWGLNSDCQVWWPLLTEPSCPFLRFVFSYSSGLSCMPS